MINDNLTLTSVLALWLVRYLPRGKGVIPRVIERLVGPREESFRLVSGANLCRPSRGLDEWVHVLANGRIADSHVIEVCEQILPEDGFMIDVGANMGVISLELAKRAPRCTICAIEPLPFLARSIRDSIDTSCIGNITVECVALGAEQGKIDLYLGKHLTQTSVNPRGDAYETLQVPVDTLDILFFETAMAVDLIKIDVEGYELSVLHGGSALIKKDLPSVVFECDANSTRSGVSLAEIELFFREIDTGYLVYGIDSRTAELVSCRDPEFKPRHSYTDFLAMSPRHQRRAS